MSRINRHTGARAIATARRSFWTIFIYVTVTGARDLPALLRMFWSLFG
ncbi:MAG: hypothetical protein WBB28_16595 [Crinalium sp.]